MSQANPTITNRRRAIVGLTAALLVSAPVATATASTADPRSPDARDAAVLAQRAAHPTPTRTDFRSPDARDAALRVVNTPRGDAGYVGLGTPAPAIARIAPASHSSTPGLAWGYVAVMLALALAAGMGLNETLRRHRLGRLLTPRA
jgi:hypothetical protein